MPPTPPRIIAATAPLRGVVLFVAGLNNRPEVLNPIATALAEKGFEAVILTLYGHDLPAWPSADYFAEWRANIDAAHQFANLNYPTQPKFAVGFSLGGTLLLDYIARTPQHRSAGLALLAPAITLTSKTTALRPLVLLGGTGLTLPSFAPKETRAHSNTSLRAYGGLFAAADAVRSTPKQYAPPTIVFAERGDELVDFDDLSEWLREAPACRLIELETPEPPAGGYYHLLFDRQNIGEAAWTQLIETLAAEFERLSGS